MSPTWIGLRNAISSIAAVTAAPPLCRWATAPAVLSTSFMTTPPCTLPSRFASPWSMRTASDVREKADVRGARSAMDRTVTSIDMTDGNRRGDEPESYDWLYGTSSKGVGSGDPTELLPGAPGDEPEAT